MTFPRLTAALGKEPTFTIVTDFLLGDELITEQQLEAIKGPFTLAKLMRIEVL